MTTGEALGGMVRNAEQLLLRFLKDFSDDLGYRTAPGLPNHAAWILGHLALTNHRGAERLLGEALPLAWDPEPFAFGSDAAALTGPPPTLYEMIARFRDSVAALADAAASLTDDGLGDLVPWGESSSSKCDLVGRMIFHMGTHTGQLIDLRRALGLGKIFR